LPTFNEDKRKEDIKNILAEQEDIEISVLIL
jgi:hypothetical protein